VGQAFVVAITPYGLIVGAAVASGGVASAAIQLQLH